MSDRADARQKRAGAWAEVERLRGLIRDAVAAQAVIGDRSGGEFLCPLCARHELDADQPGGLAHEPACPWPALVAEAEK